MPANMDADIANQNTGTKNEQPVCPRLSLVLFYYTDIHLGPS